MVLAKMTTKGQVTIPLSVRIQAQIEPGTQLDFHFESNGTIIIRPLINELMHLKGIVKSKRSTPVSLDEMKKAIHKGAGKKFK